ncbi:peptidase [Streptomyces sp. M2CJ-2]|uniref:peptidase n=1 Tax=Streptomyces sp. M2CJ-2 TaxID=2803948 RepID=UPI0019276785|nr:peptidase [Streptomyces sp. M2CJ-2]MBL3669076.1 peptidase [Streptomyces sp. M2CJ-2]
MSDNAHLARTGTAGALAIGGAVVTGWWLLAIAAGIVVIGALAIRFGYRRGKNAGQQ